MRTLQPLRLWTLAIPFTLAACSGSGDDGDDRMPPPTPPATKFVVDAADPCAGKVPTPTDIFTNDDGTTERADCQLPTDPLEGAMADAFRNLGARLQPEIKIPVDGSLDALTLSSTVTFAMTGNETGGPPPVVVLEQTATATSPLGWTVVGADVRFVDPSIVIRPRAPLNPGTFHVVVATNAIRNAESPQGKVVLTPAVTALVGEEEIVAGTYDGLDAVTAERMERERKRLAPLVELLQTASPPIPRDTITSIQGFSTDQGYGRFERLVELYFEAVDEGRYSFQATNATAPKPDIFIGVPATAYQNVQEVHVGTIKVPKLLGDDGRIRPNWHLNAEEIDLPFTFSVPSGSTRYPVALFIPGYGRGKIDVRSLAQEFAGGPQAGVMVIDLRCHGDRSPGLDGICRDNRTAQEIVDLQDLKPNNNNMELAGRDGIPDDSGIGFFPGDGVALRDSQMAAAIEIIHVLRALRSPANFQNLNPNAGNLHVIAQGHSASAAILALAETEDPTLRMTLALPSGGADYRELILEGPEDLKNAWLNTLPNGLTAAESGAYFDFIEGTLLTAVDLDKASAKIGTRFKNGNRLERVLLPHGRIPGFVTEAARESLITSLQIPNGRVSQHLAPCDDFFLFVCSLGQNPTYVAEARRQMVTFVDSGGVTVTPPGQ